jgi:hypothetical protein
LLDYSSAERVLKATGNIALQPQRLVESTSMLSDHDSARLHIMETAPLRASPSDHSRCRDAAGERGHSRHDRPENRKTASRRSFRICVAKCSDAVGFPQLNAARTQSLSPRCGLRNSSAPGRARTQYFDRRQGWLSFWCRLGQSQPHRSCSCPAMQCSDACR